MSTFLHRSARHSLLTFPRSIVASPIRRGFLSIPGTEPNSLIEERILPYSSDKLYEIISDIDSYTKFIPFCENSKVTEWTKPDTNGNKHPAQADLTVGFKGIQETFTSRLYCIPGKIVEAVAGEAATSLPKEDLESLGFSSESRAKSNSAFKSISTKWTLRPFHFKPSGDNPRTEVSSEPAKPRTQVSLEIQYQFLNPIYGSIVTAAAPRMMGMMIEAFEKRIEAKVEKDK